MRHRCCARRRWRRRVDSQLQSCGVARVAHFVLVVRVSPGVAVDGHGHPGGHGVRSCVVGAGPTAALKDRLHQRLLASLRGSLCQRGRGSPPATWRVGWTSDEALAKPGRSLRQSRQRRASTTGRARTSPGSGRARDGSRRGIQRVGLSCLRVGSDAQVLWRFTRARRHGRKRRTDGITHRSWLECQLPLVAPGLREGGGGRKVGQPCGPPVVRTEPCQVALDGGDSCTLLASVSSPVSAARAPL